MHELSVMNKVLEAALETAEKNNGSRVKEIHLVTGLMSGIVPKYAKYFFEIISEGTVAAQAELLIEQTPAVFECQRCGNTTQYDRRDVDFVCQTCGSPMLWMTSGQEFIVNSITIIRRNNHG